jgi:hypothetical protein
VPDFLINSARSLLEPGEEHLNPEYTRGLIELICDFRGLTQDSRPDVARSLGIPEDKIPLIFESRQSVSKVMDGVRERITMLQDGLYNCHPSSCATEERAHGIVVGLVGGLMAAGLSCEQSIALLKEAVNRTKTDLKEEHVVKVLPFSWIELWEKEPMTEHEATMRALGVDADNAPHEEPEVLPYSDSDPLPSFK